MTKIASLALSALFTSNLLAGCVTGDNEPGPQPEPIAFPRSCAEVAQGNPTAGDGEHTLFVGNDEIKPWVAFCIDLQTSPKEYLTLPSGGAGNWSEYSAGGRSPGTTVYTRFDKVRVDPVSLKIDISDRTFAISTGALAHLGGAQVTSLPLGVAMSCGGGYATANVDVDGTPFLLANEYTKSGDPGHVGNADLWSSGNVIEMWADGDCGWVAPTDASADPLAGSGFAIALTYQK